MSRDGNCPCRGKCLRGKCSLRRNVHWAKWQNVSVIAAFNLFSSSAISQLSGRGEGEKLEGDWGESEAEWGGAREEGEGLGRGGSWAVAQERDAVLTLELCGRVSTKILASCNMYSLISFPLAVKNVYSFDLASTSV